MDNLEMIQTLTQLVKLHGKTIIGSTFMGDRAYLEFSDGTEGGFIAEDGQIKFLDVERRVGGG